MPAAAVIPAPIAYIKVAAVKKLVVGLGAVGSGLPKGSTGDCRLQREEGVCPLLGVVGNQDFYFEKIRVFKAGICSNTLAWNNRIGRVVLFCWFLGPP